MKKKTFVASLCALMMSTNSLIASADFSDTQLSFNQQNTTNVSTEQQSNMSEQDNTTIVNDPVTANDLTTDNYLDYNKVDENQNSNNNNFGANSQELNANIDYQDFSKNMNSFLNSAGFDYNDFSSQKFDIPDMSSIGSAADLREEYSNMLADFSQFGFGQKATLPDNSGYSMNVIASFNDSFGKGLVTDFSGYEFTMDPSEVFNNANSTRNSLFQNAYNSSDYQIVAGNLNVTGIMNQINAYSIDPSSINTSGASIETLQSRISGYYENDKNKNFGNYNYLKGTDNSAFRSLEYAYIGNNTNSLKTQLEEECNNRFQKTYEHILSHDGAIDGEYSGPAHNTGHGYIEEKHEETIDIRDKTPDEIQEYMKHGELFYDQYGDNADQTASQKNNSKVEQHEFTTPSGKKTTSEIAQEMTDNAGNTNNSKSHGGSSGSFDSNEAAMALLTDAFGMITQKANNRQYQEKYLF